MRRRGRAGGRVELEKRTQAAAPQQNIEGGSDDVGGGAWIEPLWIPQRAVEGGKRLGPVGRRRGEDSRRCHRDRCRRRGTVLAGDQRVSFAGELSQVGLHDCVAESGAGSEAPPEIGDRTGE